MARKLDNGKYLCPVCKAAKPAAAFSKRKDGGVVGYCKSCRNFRARIDRAADPEHSHQILAKSRKKRREETGLSAWYQKSPQQREAARSYMHAYARRYLSPEQPPRPTLVNQAKPWDEPLSTVQLDWVERLVEKQRELTG